MTGSGVVGSREGARVLNSVPLQNAVLCAECNFVSDSPHDVCMVCGSRSLFNIARVFGGKLPKDRVSLLAQSTVKTSSRCNATWVAPAKPALPGALKRPACSDSCASNPPGILMKGPPTNRNFVIPNFGPESVAPSN